MSNRYSLSLLLGLCAGSLSLGWLGGATLHGDDQAAEECAEKEATPAPVAAPLAAKPTRADRAVKRKQKSIELDPDQHQCNICGASKPFNSFAGRKDSKCPVCKTKERHRLLTHYLQHETEIFSDTKLDMLHFAPEKGLENMLRKRPNLNYVTADLFASGVDLKLDITKIDQPDAKWDIVLAYHILEHVDDDQGAMRELYRILRPGGQAILQVPLWPDQLEIYEDPTITTPQGRAKAFGQKDHVRKYSAKGLEERLKAAGFEVEAVDYLAKLDSETIERHKLGGEFKKPRDERIWIARKPATTSKKTQKKSKKAATAPQGA